jgi:hypothetical protein
MVTTSKEARHRLRRVRDRTPQHRQEKHRIKGASQIKLGDYHVFRLAIQLQTDGFLHQQVGFW